MQNFALRQPDLDLGVTKTDKSDVHFARWKRHPIIERGSPVKKAEHCPAGKYFRANYRPLFSVASCVVR